MGGGSYYLANGSPYRNAGTTSIDPDLLTLIRQMTTYPPASLASDFTVNTTLYPVVPRDTDTPDLGYHYYALDYQGDSLTVEPGVTLALTNGVMVAVNGNNVTVNGTLVADQTLAGAQVQEAQAAPLGLYLGGNEAAAYTDTDGDGLPDWWEQLYYGNLNQTATNLDTSGNTLLLMIMQTGHSPRRTSSSFPSNQPSRLRQPHERYGANEHHSRSAKLLRHVRRQ